MWLPEVLNLTYPNFNFESFSISEPFDNNSYQTAYRKLIINLNTTFITISKILQMFNHVFVPSVLIAGNSSETEQSKSQIAIISYVDLHMRERERERNKDNERERKYSDLLLYLLISHLLWYSLKYIDCNIVEVNLRISSKRKANQIPGKACTCQLEYANVNTALISAMGTWVICSVIDRALGDYYRQVRYAGRSQDR